MTDERRLPRVALVDDHPVLCQGLAGLLRDEGFLVVGAAADLAAVLALVAREPVDALVVDLSLERESGISVLAALQEHCPGAVKVVYSVHEDSERMRRAFAAGAMGYVTKREDPDVLVEGLRQVLQGERFLSPRAARAMADALARGPARDPEALLSPQELGVYRLLGRGLDTPSIAERMRLSGRTVETYYDRILVKLELTGRRELRRHAAAHARRSRDL